MHLGDPDPLGLATTLGYLMAAFGCVCASLSGRRVGERRQSLFWLTLALLYLLLGINKQADLQILLTERLRAWALADGWYQQRRDYQLFASVTVAVVVIGSLLTVAFLIRKWPRSCGFALVAGGMQLGYIVMRLISFHYMDAWFQTTAGDFKVWKYMELGGTILCLVAALSYSLSHLASPRHPRPNKRFPMNNQPHRDRNGSSER